MFAQEASARSRGRLASSSSSAHQLMTLSLLSSLGLSSFYLRREAARADGLNIFFNLQNPHSVTSAVKFPRVTFAWSRTRARKAEGRFFSSALGESYRNRTKRTETECFIRKQNTHTA